MSASRSAGGVATEDVEGLILAGGRARRMGGQDKGLVELAGRPMAAHVLARLRPQVRRVMINANRNLDSYAALGCEVVPDTLAGYPGPLAGMLAGLRAAGRNRVLVCPCDSPRLPGALARRLIAAMTTAGAEIATVHDGERLHPVFALITRRLASDLESYLADGGRKIDPWYGRHRVVEVDFSDCPERFANVNDPAERARMEALIEAEEGEGQPT